MSRCGAVAVGVGALIGLSACGSSGGVGRTRSQVRGNGEASKPPAQILADAAAALRSAHGYVMAGEMTQAGQTMRVRVAAGPNAIELSISAGPAATEMLLLPAGAFLRANAAFWRARLGRRANLLADRWVQVPPTSAGAISAQLGHFAPATLAKCLVETHGTLSVGGRTTVTGRPAIVIRDAGDVPGDAPGTLAVATTGPAYPLRARITGPQRPGGRIDVCNDGKGTDQLGTLTFSQFGNVPPISPPPHPIRFGQTAAT